MIFKNGDVLNTFFFFFFFFLGQTKSNEADCLIELGSLTIEAAPELGGEATSMICLTPGFSALVFSWWQRSCCQTATVGLVGWLREKVCILTVA
ncbi:unnamed protein product [Camellia sinensis]